jgi:alkylated DNA repair dioxygenase AlkB
MSQTIQLWKEGDEELLYVPQFASDGLMGVFEKNIVWRQNTIRIYGKEHLEPRLTAWFGPPYKYSSIAWERQEVPFVLQSLFEEVSTHCAFAFNAVLCNYYRHGQDAMGWHRDNEPEINQACIASISLGSPRKFVIRKRSDSKYKLELNLGKGDLLVMRNMQQQWEHAVMKTARQVGPRINLTFREVY